MHGLEGDLEEWQTQEVNVTRGKAEGDIDLETTRGEAEGDIDLEGLPFLTRGPRHYLFCYYRQFYFFMHILIFTVLVCGMTDSDTLVLHVNFSDELQK